LFNLLFYLHSRPTNASNFVLDSETKKMEGITLSVHERKDGRNRRTDGPEREMGVIYSF